MSSCKDRPGWSGSVYAYELSGGWGTERKDGSVYDVEVSVSGARIGGRNVFVSRERAYHGVNWGGVSLSGLVNNRRKFGTGLPGIAHMRHP